ncbi:MAG: hypothetical protein NVSMB62_24270 [Acidobacteriaceae bacterium]
MGAAPSLIHKVVVHDDRIEILIARAQVLQALRTDAPSVSETNMNPPLTIEVPAVLKRKGGEVRLQLPPDGLGARSRPVPSLVRAVARAHDWVDQAN